MPYCPKCDLEFVEGMTVCTKCHAPLVAEKEVITVNRVPVAHVAPEDSDRIIAFLEYSGVKNVLTKEDPEEGTICLLCPEKEYPMAIKLLQVFYANEMKKSLEEIQQEEAEEKSVGVYVKKSDKIREARSSAYSTLFVGAIVLAFVLLWFFGVIDLPFSKASEILMQVVFFAMGLIFVLAGMNTFRGMTRLEKEAKSEAAEYDEAIAWFISTYNKDYIEKNLDRTGAIDNTLLDFGRLDLIREKLLEKYPSDDESYIEALCEEIYQKLYEH